MLRPIKNKSRKITKVVSDGKICTFMSEAGMLRIGISFGDVVRVSYTDKDEFDCRQGSFLMPFECDETSVAEIEHGYRIACKYTSVEIEKATGRVTVFRDGEMLFSEGLRERTLDRFDALRLKKNGRIETVDIPTADGVKKRVVNAEREYYGTFYHTRTYFEFEPDEMIFGLGQYEEGIWNYRGMTRYIHQANKQIAIPAFVSSKGYGVMFTTESPAIFSDTAAGTFVNTSADYFIDYFVIAPGSFNAITDRIRTLTGRASLLPKWTYSYVQSKERYETQEEILKAAEEFERREIPTGCIVLDWFSWEDGMWGQKTFDKKRFPDVPSMVQQLREKNIHFMLSIWPAMDPKCDNFREMKEADLLLPGTNVYDAFSPEGRALYWQQVQRGLAAEGVENWWCDSSEPITPEWEAEIEPLPHEKYENYLKTASDSLYTDKGNTFGLYHARGIYEGQRAAYPDRRVVNLTRSGYFGSGQYGAVLWSGDISATWEVFGRQITEGLQLAMCGIPYWTLDIGAFFTGRGRNWYWAGDFDDNIQNPGYKELYVRWLQYGSFLSMFRCHGTEFDREPWNFGDAGDRFYDAIVDSIRIRDRLVPYFYSVGAGVALRNEMFIRPLFYAFPDDKNCYKCSSQFTVGDRVMVAPVTKPMYYDKTGAPLTFESTEFEVYLPAGGCWYNFHTGEKYDGGQTVAVPAPLEQMPVFVRAGGIIPMRDKDGLKVRIYAGADGSFEMYSDAKDGFGYETGEYLWTKIDYCDRTGDYSVSLEGRSDFAEEFKTEVIK